MGYNTWCSLHKKKLKNRYNLILSKKHIKKLTHAIDLCIKNENIENIFIIGGCNVYLEAIKLYKINSFYFTYILSNYKCDTFFPYIEYHKYISKYLIKDIIYKSSSNYIIKQYINKIKNYI